jgi:glucosamine-6-phosphate deaminase
MALMAMIPEGRGKPMSTTISPLVATSKDRLNVRVYSDRRALGEAAAVEAIKTFRRLLDSQERLRVIFAAAPSQNEFLAALVQAEGIEWSRVTAFHMDDYIGLPADSPQRFSHFLNTRLFGLVKPGVVRLIDSTASAEGECERYQRLLQEQPIDIVCLGIGENGHIAFNDPPVADFSDPRWVKPVELDEACRRQQVNDGCFPSFADVPTHALTLTIPALMSGKHLFCMVPGPTKRAAVERTLNGPIATECPASILRRHPDCTLYVDTDSYGHA